LFDRAPRPFDNLYLADIVSGIPINPKNIFLCILGYSELMPPIEKNNYLYPMKIHF